MVLNRSLHADASGMTFSDGFIGVLHRKGLQTPNWINHFNRFYL